MSVNAYGPRKLRRISRLAGIDFDAAWVLPHHRDRPNTAEARQPVPGGCVHWIVNLDTGDKIRDCKPRNFWSCPVSHPT